MLVTISICIGSGDELGLRIYLNTNFRYLKELFLTKKVSKLSSGFLNGSQLLSPTFNTFAPYLKKKKLTHNACMGVP